MKRWDTPGLTVIPGRPDDVYVAKEKGRDGRRISIRVSDELYKLIEAAAGKKEWSLAHWVERAIEERLGASAKAIPRKIRRAPTRSR